VVRFSRTVARIDDFIGPRNPDAALEVVSAIIDAAISLLDYPELGRTGATGRTRELVLPRYPYTICYRSTRNIVRIVRVIHQSQKHP
jgi:plasmid stabilization system protein ParE